MTACSSSPRRLARKSRSRLAASCVGLCCWSWVRSRAAEPRRNQARSHPCRRRRRRGSSLARNLRRSALQRVRRFVATGAASSMRVATKCSHASALPVRPATRAAARLVGPRLLHRAMIHHRGTNRRSASVRTRRATAAVVISSVVRTSPKRSTVAVRLRTGSASPTVVGARGTARSHLEDTRPIHRASTVAVGWTRESAWPHVRSEIRVSTDVGVGCVGATDVRRIRFTGRPSGRRLG